MATARNIIQRSLRLLGVLASGEAMTADEADDGLTALTSMLDSWELDSLISSSVVPSFTDLSTDVVLPTGYQDAITYNLAVRLAAEYGRQTPAEVANFAAKTLGAIMRNQVAQLTASSEIYRLSSRLDTYDITTG